jgi:hypothetical protein
MTKHDMLPFKMIIERGRLVPAEPYDAERLDTWRNGTRVNVIFARDGGRVMERKWWAICNRAVKECKTPWKTANEASEAIKLAIGVVNLTKTVGGEFMAYPKSLTELEDPELDEAVEQMVNVVHRITGVDPEEWKKQVSHIRDEKSSDTPADDNGSDGSPSPGQTVAADSSATSENQNPDEAASEAGDVETQEEPDVSSASDLVTRNLMVECLEKFMALASDETVPEATKRRHNVEFAKNAWKEALPQRLDFVKTCFETADKIVKGELGAEAAKRYLEGLV